MVIQLRKDYESVPRFLTCPLKGYESRVSLRSILGWLVYFNYSCWIRVKPKQNQSTIERRDTRDSYPFRGQVRKQGTDS